MNILLVITSAKEIGGAQIHVRDLAIGLRENGHKVTILHGSNGVFTDMLRELNIPTIETPSLVREISPIKDISAVYHIVKAIKKIDPDIVSCHSTKSGVVGRVAAYITKRTSVFTAHGWSFTEGINSKKRFVYSSVERLLARVTDAIINVSAYDLKIADKNKIRSKHYVIHNGVHDRGVNLEKFNDLTKINILIVARFCEQKDHESFLKALPPLINKYNFSVQLVGGGDSSYCEKLAFELNLNQHVLFLGESKNVDGLLKQAHIFCLPSNWEGFPISIIEAMSNACYILASDVGGVSEAITDSHKLISRKDITGWTNSLISLYENKNKLKDGAMELRQEYEREFTVDKMITQYLVVFNNCMIKRESKNENIVIR